MATAGAIIAAVMLIYGKTVKPSSWINGKADAFMGVLSALEQAKTMNGGAYPLASTAINNLGNLGSISASPPNLPANTLYILKTVIGDTNANYNSWTYACGAVANTLSIQVYVGDESSDDKKNALTTYLGKIAADMACSYISTSPSVITCTKTGITCS